MSEYPGIYRGVCTQVKSATSTLIKVKVPQLLGSAALEEWAEACVPPGWKQGLVKHETTGAHAQYTGSGDHTHGDHVQHQLTPKVGEGVWVMFIGGDPDHPVWLGVFGAQ